MCGNTEMDLLKSHVPLSASGSHYTAWCRQQCRHYNLMCYVYTLTCRKQCLHCGCARSAHSIEAEPSAVIPMLEQLTLGDGASKLTRADIERLAKYAWYPPGVSYGVVRL